MAKTCVDQPGNIEFEILKVLCDKSFKKPITMQVLVDKCPDTEEKFLSAAIGEMIKREFIEFVEIPGFFYFLFSIIFPIDLYGYIVTERGRNKYYQDVYINVQEESMRKTIASLPRGVS